MVGWGAFMPSEATQNILSPDGIDKKQSIPLYESNFLKAYANVCMQNQ
jgi:hypothetical protein